MTFSQSYGTVVHRSFWDSMETMAFLKFFVFALCLPHMILAGGRSCEVDLQLDNEFNSPGRTIPYNFVIDYIVGAPDGVRVDHILGINGQFPGPMISAVKGDRVRINVTNRIRDGQDVAIHWHGIRQFMSVFQDGPAHIVQCPIRYGHSQIYEFFLGQAGTYWYHSHEKSQYTEGLWGVIVVHNLREVHCKRYDETFTITLTDWYHQSAHENEIWHLSPQSLGAPPYPDSALLNGRGRYPCDMAPEKPCNPREQYRHVYRLHHNKTYRIRIINVSAFSTFNVTVDGHMFEVIEVDGIDVGRVNLKEGFSFGPGQRYSVVLYRLNDVQGDRFLFRAKARTRYMFQVENNINKHQEAYKRFAEVTAVFDFSQRSINDQYQHYEEGFDYRQVLPPPFETDPTFLNDLDLSPVQRDPAPDKFDHQVILDMSFTNTTDDRGRVIRRGSFNNLPYIQSKGMPLLLKMMLDQPRPRFPQEARVFEIKLDDVVEIIVNNKYDGSHQVHLHGHHFWVLTKGDVNAGDYNRNNPDHRVRILGAARRDTVAVKQKSFLVIRWKADNPGMWTFHCHIDWHNLSGMAINFMVDWRAARRMLNITSEARKVCRTHNIHV